MKLTTVKIMKRKNLGNYEHEEITMEAVLSETEDATLAIIGLRDLVHIALNGDDVKLGRAAEEILGGKTTPADPSKVVNVKDKISGAEGQINYGGVVGSTASEVPGKVPEVIKEKAKRNTKTEAKTDASPSANAGGTSTVVGTVDTKNVTTVQSTTPAANTPVDKNVVVYDTKVVEHRSRFATYLGQTFPNWKPDAKFGATPAGQEMAPEKAAYAESVKKFSLGLHGKAFEDTKGNMLESFKAELASFFG